MDPDLWEQLKTNTERAVRESGEDGVRLVGGIMDGWLVRRDADALKPGWYETNPANLTAGPGRYVLSESGSHAEWVPAPSPNP